MLDHFSNLIELLDYFKDKETCMKYWEDVRWGGNVTCVHCGHDKVYRTNRGFKCCSKECGKKFSALVGSIFENTKLPLRTWFAAIFLETTSKKGISAMQLSRQLKIGLKAAWFMLHRIRKAFGIAEPEILEGIVQVDETFVGGKNKNRHHNKKVKHSTGRVFIDKTPVLGMLETGGRVILKTLADTKTATLQPLVRKHVRPGSILFTDDWNGYNGLYDTYEHEIVDHGRGQYVNQRTGATTNAIENFWSTFKKGIIGIYQWISRQHMQLYCNEFMFRFNHRHLKVSERFMAAVRCAAGVRMTYFELVN